MEGAVIVRRPADDKSLVGLAGEYHVLAQLAERGLVGALTLGHTKGVDILVTNPVTSAVHQIEVKTTRAKPGRAPLFGEGRFFSWPLSEKQEKPLPAGWFFCFVRLEGAGRIPRFFLVPALKVAEYVRWEHQHWLTSRPGARDNPIRQFRIPESDPDGYENNWDVFA
jgi:hypothetical protein